MSHEININDTVVYGSNTPAWHGLGTVFAGLLSPLRVFAEGVGHRDILEVPVRLNGLVLPGHKGLVGITAKGVQVPLSVVGEGYGVLKSESMYKILEGVYAGKAVVDAAGTLRNGAREWCLVKRSAWDVKKGDTVLTYDLWLNRHDGSGCFELHRTNIRVVCANTWKMAVQGGNRVFGVRHTKNVEQGVQSALQVLGYVEAQERTQRAAAQRMATDSAGLFAHTQRRRSRRYGSCAGASASQASKKAAWGAKTGMARMAAETSSMLAMASSADVAARSSPLAASRSARSALHAKRLSW